MVSSWRIGRVPLRSREASPCLGPLRDRALSRRLDGADRAHAAEPEPGRAREARRPGDRYRPDLEPGAGELHLLADQPLTPLPGDGVARLVLDRALVAVLLRDRRSRRERAAG